MTFTKNGSSASIIKSMMNLEQRRRIKKMNALKQVETGIYQSGTIYQAQIPDE